MDFEFDAQKSLSNREKHGIDFSTAQKIWENDVLEIPARTIGESRWLVIGKLGPKYWSAIITYRGDRVRIISVRRSRDEEKELYNTTI